MPPPIPPFLAALLLLGVLALLVVGRDVFARLDGGLGSAASPTALAVGALVGAGLAPEPVAVTLASRILVPGAVAPGALVYAFLAVLAVATGLLAAFPEGLGDRPFSTTQAAVGALVGAALAGGGVAGVGLLPLAATVAAWVLVPAAAAATAHLLAGRRLPEVAAWGLVSAPAGLLLARPLETGPVPGLASLGGLLVGLAAAPVLARSLDPVGERGSAAAVGALGLAVGATEAANVLGPLAAALGVLEAGAPVPLTQVPLDLRLLAGGALVVGFAAWRPDDLDGDGGPDPADLFALAGGAAAPLALGAAVGLPVPSVAAVLGAGAGLAAEGGLRGAVPWRRVVAGAASWFLLGLALTWFLATFLLRLLV